MAQGDGGEISEDDEASESASRALSCLLTLVVSDEALKDQPRAVKKQLQKEKAKHGKDEKKKVGG
jgi:hypothetical protein